MVPLINREKELDLIEDAVTALTSDDRLVETPIVNFFGLPGIGKSRLLEEVTIPHDQQHVCLLRLEAREDIPIFSQTAMQRVQRYLPEMEPPASLEASLGVLKALLDTTSLVLLIDSIESTDERQLSSLGIILKDLILSNNIFIILASQDELYFPNQRNVRRKLISQRLPFLNREQSKRYFQVSLPSLNEEQQERLFTWTKGHPLTIEELVNAIRENPDLANEDMQLSLVLRLLDVLITRRLQALPSKKREEFAEMLPLLAVPRRFNVIVIRLLVKEFAPSYHLSSSVEYLKLPQEIGRVTGVLQWKRELAGFTLEEPVRTLYLYQLKMQFADRYNALNGFLADLNLEYARDTADMEDRVQYEKEFVYHRLVTEELDKRRAAAEAALQQIFTLAGDEQTQLLRFQEEFLADEGLQEELGEDSAPIRQHIYQKIADVLYRLYQAANPENQGRAFDALFLYLQKIQERDHEVRDRLIAEYLQRIKTEISSDWLIERYETWERDGFNR